MIHHPFIHCERFNVRLQQQAVNFSLSLFVIDLKNWILCGEAHCLSIHWNKFLNWERINVKINRVSIRYSSLNGSKLEHTRSVSNQSVLLFVIIHIIILPYSLMLNNLCMIISLTLEQFWYRQEHKSIWGNSLALSAYWSDVMDKRIKVRNYRLSING